MIYLHFLPGAASFAPHVLLNELGLPYELVPEDRERQTHKSPAYLALNPNGLIPVLREGELVLYETMAILLHLADSHPEAGLAPPLGSAERAHFYKWAMWLTNTLQATLIHYFYPERMVAEGNAEGVAQVRAAAEARVVGLLAQLDAQLQDAGPWLLGQHYSALDPMAFMLCRWTRNFGSRPAREFAHLRPYLERMLQRPAVRLAFEQEGLTSPWF